MSIRSLLLLCFSIMYTALSHAQTVVWEGRSETLLHFDPSYSSDAPIEAIPLKVVQADAAMASRTPFRDALIGLIRSGKWKAYINQAGQTLPHDKAMELFVRVDTVITFDPETYEESLNVIKTDLLDNCRYFRLRQEWTYYAGGGITCRATAISPYLLGVAGKPNGPVIWFELPEPRKRFNDPTQRRVKLASLLHYDIHEQQLQHNTGNWAALQQGFIGDFKAGRFPGYTEDRRIITQAEAEGIFNAADTIYTIDPESYTESFEVVEREFRPEDIRALRIEQAWYLEPRTGRLQSDLLRIAPAVAVVDEYGTLRFYRPIFFWKQ